MYVLVAYDVDAKRVAKVHKVLKKYLIWTQNSLFEGEITEGLLKQCMAEIATKANPAVDLFMSIELQILSILKR